MKQTIDTNRFLKTHNLTSSVIILALYVSLLTVELVLAQSGGKFELSRSTISGGGGHSSGGPYVLTGTIGQPDAAWSAGGNYEVLGGFWAGGPSCFVEFDDFARFAVYWLQSGSGLPADLYPDDTVNADDLLEFVNWWLCTCPYDWPLN